MEPCPFCERIGSGDGLLASTALSVAFPDAYPVADGHVLVVPRRHVARAADLDEEEWYDLHRLGGRMAAGAGADAVNYGLNDGDAAGQTVGHVHLHVIPRRTGDVPDPRGGIRWVLPDRAPYWEQE